MAIDHFKYHRRSIRCNGYDYTRAGAYFVTICVKGGRCPLGEVVDGAMHLNEWGRVVENEWLRTAVLREHVALDVFQVMPNHFHATIWITDGVHPPTVGATRASPPSFISIPSMPPRGPIPGSLGAIVGGFKSAVTRQINQVQSASAAPFWQRNYYERIIRNERQLSAVRQYLHDNPANWQEDRLHLDASPRSSPYPVRLFLPLQLPLASGRKPVED